MAFVDGGSIAVFPLAFIKQCVETYTKNHGKTPALLVLAEEDYLDYKLSCTLASAKQLNLKVTYGSYLKPGEIDLCMGIKEKSKGKKNEYPFAIGRFLRNGPAGMLWLPWLHRIRLRRIRQPMVCHPHLPVPGSLSPGTLPHPGGNVKKFLALLLVCMAGCAMLPKVDVHFDGTHNEHSMYRINCQSGLSACRQATVGLVTRKCGSSNWMVVLGSEAYGTSQYWVECMGQH